VQPCSSASHGGRWTQRCSGNATSLLGRDCAPVIRDATSTNVGTYVGAINLQLAWRRNAMQELEFLGGQVRACAGRKLGEVR
jgi:hypothetical protein